MSRAKTAKCALPAIAILASGACASTSAGGGLTAEEQAYQNAIEQALSPATAEEIAQADRSDPITRANFWSNEYQKDPANLDNTVSFMRALRAIGSHDRVREVATVSVPIHPDSHEILLELGRSMVAQERFEDAVQVLVRSADLSPPSDATPLAVLGLAFDRSEEHEKAQQAYEYALAREPGRATTLSNYGLSLAITGKLDAAETALRKAVEAPGADVRVRQNLALVLGLQGRFEDMVAIDPDAPRRSIEANQRALRDMIAPQRNYDDLQNLDDVLDELERTPSAETEMPEVPEALVEAESMQDPLANGGTTRADAELAGNGPQPDPALKRPTLRGSQGR